MAPDASVYKLSLWLLLQVSFKNKDLPLKEDKKVCQMQRSPFTLRFSRMKKCGSEILCVKSINHLKKVRPGVTTEHAKLSKPIKD